MKNDILCSISVIVGIILSIVVQILLYKTKICHVKDKESGKKEMKYKVLTYAVWVIVCSIIAIALLVYSLFTPDSFLKEAVATVGFTGQIAVIIICERRFKRMKNDIRYHNKMNADIENR